MLATGSERYETAPWLESDFKSMQWKCNFSASGSFLLDFENLVRNEILTQQVVTIIKYWLVICTGTTERLGKAKASQYHLINAACAWVDYLILNESYFEFRHRGFSLLTVDALRGALEDICSHSSRETAIYDYPSAVHRLVSDGASRLSEIQVDQILAFHPALKSIASDDLKHGFSAEKIRSMRAWLHQEGLLKWTGKARFHLNSRKIGIKLFSNTLRGGACSWPILEVFSNEIDFHRGRRFAAVSTTSKRKAGTVGRSQSERAYIRCIKFLAGVEQLDIHSELLPPPQTIGFAESLNAGQYQGRFLSLPPEVVFSSLRGAIEFCATHGDAVADSYIQLVKKIKPGSDGLENLSSSQILSCIDKQLVDKGVISWSGRDRSRDTLSRFAAEELENDATSNLYTWIKVLYGATIVIVGTLMARRQAELVKLDSESALDEKGENLIFGNAKSTRLLGGLRVKEARPILGVAAQAIRRLQGIHQILRTLGYLNGPSMLIQHPNASAPHMLVLPGPKTYAGCVDAFCDFIQTPLIDGKRYYIRQHQLRRFFCMVFFWHRSFAGLDTLRWFLGHHDVEQIYRYITESTPGSVLRAAKAQHTVENISSHQNLRSYLIARFGIGDFSLLETDQLEAYVAILLEEGAVSIEPVFFEDSSGKDYKIIVKVLDHGTTDSGQQEID